MYICNTRVLTSHILGDRKVADEFESDQGREACTRGCQLRERRGRDDERDLQRTESHREPGIPL